MFLYGEEAKSMAKRQMIGRASAKRNLQKTNKDGHKNIYNALPSAEDKASVR